MIDDRNHGSAARKRARIQKRLRQERQAIFRRQVSRPIQLESLESRYLLAVTPQLLGDIGVQSQDLDNITPVGGTTFFVASSPEVGAELWKTDGTPDGTVIVKDIEPGSDGSRPRELINVGGVLYFSAATGDGRELWKSDGTESGTVLVKDIQDGTTGSYPSSLTEFDGMLFFEANGGINGRELWKSDGTPEGTEQVADINPNGADSSPDHLKTVGDTLYFRATGPDGRELYKSDGTSAGTTLVEDINPSGDSNPSGMVNVGDTLYFQADDGTHGNEIWKSDGTPEGTTLVKDIYEGGVHSSPHSLVNFDGVLYFQANDGSSGAELWKSDGSETGTTLVKDINPDLPSSSPTHLTVIGSEFYFTATDGENGYELWKSDGTETGTVLVKDISAGGEHSFPFDFTQIGGNVFFSAYSAASGSELWKTDGSEGGTVLVRDATPGPQSTYPTTLRNVGGTLLFSGIVNGRLQLMSSDGTEAGTTPLKQFSSSQGSEPEQITAVNGVAFFVASNSGAGYELWKSDGTIEGTSLVKDIQSGAGNGSYPTGLVNVGGTLFFEATDDSSGSELWKSDGTEAGTVLIKDINPGSYYSGARYLTNVSGIVYFSASDGVNGYELWKSDGTSDGTTLVKDINPAGDSVPFNLVNVNGVLYFTANDGSNGYELWKSDGTSDGTVLVKDINPTGSSTPYYMTSLGGLLLFQADDGVHGTELWKSDGTEDGTELVKDIHGSASSNPKSFVELDGQLFFQANDGSTGAELWRTDGTEGGTALVKDIQSGPDDSRILWMTNLNGKLLFQADDGNHGAELWSTDGSETGTILLKDIQTGPDGSIPEYLTVVNGTAYFAAQDDLHGAELWQTDGTEAGTQIAADIAPGTWDSAPARFAVANGRLFFNAQDGVHGYELWAVIPANTAVLPATGGTSSLSIDPDTGNLVIRDSEGNVLFDDAPANLPELHVHGQDGVDDEFTVDFTNGNPIPPGGITFHGGAGGFDTLNLVNTNAGLDATTIVHRASSATDGTIEFDFTGSGSTESTVRYTGLEPVVDNLDAVNRTFQFTFGDAETVTLADDAALTAGFSQIGSTASELVVFANPTGSLTIETSTAGGAGADAIHIEGLDPDFAADLTVAGDGDDTITFQTSPTDTAGGAIFASANDIVVNVEVRSGGASMDIVALNNIVFGASGSLAQQTGASPMTILADGDVSGTGGIQMANGSTIDAGDGDIEITAADAIILGVVSTTAEVRIQSREDSIQAAAAGMQNVIAGQAALRALDGVDLGTQVESLAATTENGNIQIVNSFASGGTLTVGTVDGLEGVTSTNGDVSIEATSLADGTTAIRVENAVSANGPVQFIVQDTNPAGASDNLTIASPAVVSSATGLITLNVGDDFLLEAGATLSSGALVGGIGILLDATATDPDGGPDLTGSTMDLLGTIIADGGTNIVGGDDADTFNVTPDSLSTGSIQVTGGSGDDQFVVQLGQVAGGILIVEDPANGDDKLTIQGTAVADEITVSSTQTTASTDTIEYGANLEALEIRAGAGDDTVEISPSTTLLIDVLGGDPTAAPGDTLLFNTPGGESSTLVPSTTDSGTVTTSGAFQSVSYSQFESLGALVVTLDSPSISESGGSTTGTVTRLDPSGDLTVDLMSDDTSEATVVATATFLDGETVSSVFTVTAVDDSELDGTRTVTITASAAGHVGGQRTLEVTDLETLTITIAADSVAEDAGAIATTATVSRSNTDTAQPLEVTLTNGDPSAIGIPSTVIIPANESSVTWDPLESTCRHASLSIL